MFIQRRRDGSIVGTFTQQQWDDQEELPDDHPDVVAFHAAIREVQESSRNTIAALKTRIETLETKLNGKSVVS